MADGDDRHRGDESASRAASEGSRGRWPRAAGAGGPLFVVAAFVSGWMAFGVGSAGGRHVIVAHGVLGFAALFAALFAVAADVWPRARRDPVEGRGARRVLAGAVGVTVVLGVALVVGVWSPSGGPSTLTLHVVAGVATVVVLAWFVVARLRRRVRVRRSDRAPVEGRREMLGRTAAAAGGLVVAGWASRQVLETALDVAGSEGADRRFTGSFEVASFDPANLPAVTWLDDSNPYSDVERARYELLVEGPDGETVWRYAELADFDDRLTATLDCTGGWYSTQRWEGVRVERLVGAAATGRSLLVHSATGYTRRFPLGDVPHLLLATRIGGEPLRPRHGAPVRLVARSRRAFWWVKWVDRIEVSDAPAWWQPPFPLS